MKLRTLACVLCAALPLPGIAKDLTYDRLTVGYADLTVARAGDDLDADGVGASISKSIGTGFVIGFGYAALDVHQTVDDPLLGPLAIDGSLTDYTLSFDWHTAVSGSTDVVFGVAYLDTAVDLTICDTTPTCVSGNGDDTGYGLAVGIRSMASDRLELGASINSTNYDETNTSFSIGAAYFLTDALAIGVGFTTGDDVSGYAIGVRAEF